MWTICILYKNVLIGNFGAKYIERHGIEGSVTVKTSSWRKLWFSYLLSKHFVTSLKSCDIKPIQVHYSPILRKKMLNFYISNQPISIQYTEWYSVLVIVINN